VRKRPERPQSRWVFRIESAAELVRMLALVGLAECVLALMSLIFDSYPLAQTVSAMGLPVTLLATRC